MLTTRLYISPPNAKPQEPRDPDTTLETPWMHSRNHGSRQQPHQFPKKAPGPAEESKQHYTTGFSQVTEPDTGM
ncbi:hypothetical protein Bca4012_018810 [Brassica carinata]